MALLVRSKAVVLTSYFLSLRQITFSVTFQNNLAMLQDLWSIYNASTADISGVAGIQWTLTLQPIVPAIAAQSKAKGGNVLGVLDAVPSQGLVLIELSATFDAANNYATVIAAANGLLAHIIAAARANDAYNQFVDMNHAGASQDPIANYGRQNQLFIEQTAKEYDPQGVFQQLMPGGFKYM